MAFNRDRNRPSGGGGFSPRFAGGAGRSRLSFNDRGRSGGSFGRTQDKFSRGPVEMYQAVCDNCGKNCEVPFRPTQGKPIFCSDCFRKQKEGSERSESRNFDRPNNFRERSDEQPHREQANSYDEQFKALNAKVDSILKILESVSNKDKEVINQLIEEPVIPKVAKKKKALVKKSPEAIS